MPIEVLKGIWPEWSIGKRIGGGAYGTVYEASRNDYGVENHAAIKIVSIPSGETEVDMLRAEGLDEQSTKTYFEKVVSDFVNEIRLMVSLEGRPNIVNVKDYRVVQKKEGYGWYIFILMELLTPFSVYTSEHKLSEAEVIRLGCDICTALETCAEENIIHRDVKPGNILVHKSGSFKLGDFGIAKKLQSMTGSLSQRYTPKYMAPEVSTSVHYDARVDIYSLGIVLYELLNEKRIPFQPVRQIYTPADIETAVSRRNAGEELPAPCEASPAMADLILRACAFDPDRRFASAAQMKQALISVANGTYKNSTLSADKTTAVRRVPAYMDQTVSVRKAPVYADQMPGVRRAPEVQPQPVSTENVSQQPRPVAYFDGKTKQKKNTSWGWILVPLMLVALIATFALGYLNAKNDPQEEQPEPVASGENQQSEPVLTEPMIVYEVSNAGEKYDPYDIQADGYCIVTNTPAKQGYDLLEFHIDQESSVGKVAEGQLVMAMLPYSTLDNGYVFVVVDGSRIRGWIPVGYLAPVNPYADTDISYQELEAGMYARVYFDTPDDGGINFRAKPSSKSARLALFHEGTVVEVLDNYNPNNYGYIKVGYSHSNSGEYMVGWVLAQHLEYYGYQ